MLINKPNFFSFLFDSMLFRKPLDKLFVFVHLPKCAGTSLLKTFSQIGQRRFVVVAENDLKSEALSSLKLQMAEHKITASRLDLVMGRDTYFGIQNVSPREPYFFTFIREPIQRYLSQYRYYVDCASDPKHHAHEMAVDRLDDDGRRMSLEEYVESGRGDNFLCKVLGSIAPSRENHDWFWNVSDEEALFAAKEMIDHMSFIGFLDNIESDTKLICDQLKIKPELPTINRSFANITVSGTTRKMIERNNGLDIQLFEYAQNRRRELDSQRELPLTRAI